VYLVLVFYFDGSAARRIVEGKGHEICIESVDLQTALDFFEKGEVQKDQT
jgi:hypothetical protein